jgi:hypothetical protein
MTARFREQVVRRTATTVVSILGVLATTLVACAKVEGERGEGGIAIRALSTKPDMVSGGDVLIGVEGDARALEGLSVSLNGADVTPKFKSDGGRLVGLVDGLKPGPNTVEVRGKRGATARTSLVNHAITRFRSRPTSSRLEQIFDAGVCDWSKPGVEQTRLKGTWLRF